LRIAQIEGKHSDIQPLFVARLVTAIAGRYNRAALHYGLRRARPQLG
jgi:hypothetical protein